MFFADEVRDPRALVPRIDEVEVSDRELQLAQTLIDTLKVEWNPARYADTYREELLRWISERRRSHREGTAAEIPTGRVEELMEALKASVEEAKKANKKAKKSERNRAA